MHILEISPEWPPYIKGGIGTHVYALVSELRSAGHTVDVAGPTPPYSVDEYSELEGAVLVRSNERDDEEFGMRILHQNFSTSLAIREIKARAPSMRHDIVSIHHFNQALSAIAFASSCQRPLIWHAHGLYHLPEDTGSSFSSTVSLGAERGLAEHASRVICVSRYLADLLQRSLKVPTDRIRVIPKGVMPASAAERDRSSSRKRSIAYVGRISYEKGLDILLDSIAMKADALSGLQLHIAGVGEDAGYVDMILKKIAAVSRSGVQVALHGFVQPASVSELYRTVEAVIIPSRSESFGRAAIEAMNMGTPVFASNAGGLPEVVRDGLTGRTFSTMEELGNLIVDSLADASALKTYSLAGIELVEAEFSLKDIVRRTLDVYTEVAA